MILGRLKVDCQDNNWTSADSIVNYISKFQNRYGTEVMPAAYKIQLEIDL